MVKKPLRFKGIGGRPTKEVKKIQKGTLPELFKGLPSLKSLKEANEKRKRLQH